MRYRMGIFSALICVVALQLTAPLAAQSVSEAKYDAEIVRDEFGVPHIHGKTYADAAYGLAYAASEDNFATLQATIIAAKGRSGQVYGRQGAVLDYGREFFGVVAAVERDYASLPADVRAMLEGYAAGVNRYAAKHPKQVRSKNIFPLLGKDIATGFALVSLQFYGLGEEVAKLYANQLPVAPEADRGSNGFAVAPARMADGKTWLIANPHLPFEGAYAWYEAVVHSDEGLDFAGATLLGSPFMFVGHNRNLGWTVTLNNPDLIDVYKLTVNAKGDQYLYDGKWLSFDKQKLKLPVKAGIINVTATREILRSVHGPVIVNKTGSYAVRFAGMSQIRMLEQYYRLNKAQDWTQWQQAMEVGGIPSTNYVYADKTGRIAYFYNALFPNRPPGFDYSGVLAGDTSANVWQGYQSSAAMPKVIDPASGFVFSANNSPFHAAGAGSNLRSADFSPLIGIEKRMTNRAWRAEELLSASGVMTPDALLAIKMDTGYSRSSYVKVWIDKLLAVDTSARPDLAEAQALIKSWDWNSDGNGAADTLVELLLAPAHTSNHNGRPLPDAKSFLDAITVSFKQTYGRLDLPLSDVTRLRRGSVNLPMIGGVDALRTAKLTYDTQLKSPRVNAGDSFIMLTNWDQQGRVSSQSVVPYGSSNNPDSPHYADQAALVADRRFKNVHFEWSDALAHGGVPYRP